MMLKLEVLFLHPQCPVLLEVRLVGHSQAHPHMVLLAKVLRLVDLPALCQRLLRIATQLALCTMPANRLHHLRLCLENHATALGLTCQPVRGILRWHSTPPRQRQASVSTSTRMKLPRILSVTPRNLSLWPTGLPWVALSRARLRSIRMPSIPSTITPPHNSILRCLPMVRH